VVVVITLTRITESEWLMKTLKYKAGDIVIASKQMIEEATGDHPRFELCSKGQKLKVIEADSKYSIPYLVRDIECRYGEFSLKENELL